MSFLMRKQFLFCFVLLCLTAITACLAHGKDSLSLPAEPVAAEKAILKLADDLHRDTSRSSMIHLLEAITAADFKNGSNYLDFRNLPSKIKKIPEEELTGIGLAVGLGLTAIGARLLKWCHNRGWVTEVWKQLTVVGWQ